MTPEPLALLVALFAAYRLTRLIVRDAFPPVKAARDWVLHRWPSADAEVFEGDVGGGGPGARGDLAVGLAVGSSGPGRPRQQGAEMGGAVPPRKPDERLAQLGA